MSVRVDKWLWAARFFKTRGLSSESVKGGHVSLNGMRTKPAKEVKVGDVLTMALACRKEFLADLFLDINK